MVGNGPNSSMPVGSDINIVNNLYSTVDLSQKHQRRISSDGKTPFPQEFIGNRNPVGRSLTILTFEILRIQKFRV